MNPTGPAEQAGSAATAGRRDLGDDLAAIEAALAEVRTRVGADALDALEARLVARHRSLVGELARRNRAAARGGTDGPGGSAGAPAATPESAAGSVVESAPSGYVPEPLVPARPGKVAARSPAEVAAVAPVGAEAALAVLRASPLHTSAAPKVSVVIPMFNHAADTLRCLASIASRPPDVAFEVVVVDDCSTEASVRVLDDLAGVRVVRTPENGGFVRACNHGASVAVAPLLFFLNNDTEVGAGALDALVDTLGRDASIGVVGAKLLWPDGTVQEAGGLLFADGSAWNYGRGWEADRPEVEYTRDVPYVSGAALLIRRELFDAAGGFDLRYAPAYFEDADLCMGVRSLGHRVVYQPRAEIVHHEGRSYGTGERDDRKRRQMEVNQRHFSDRWREQFVGLGERGRDVDLVKDGSPRCRTLVVDHRMITPDRDAGSLRMGHIVRILREVGGKVTFVPANGLPMEPYASALRDAGVEVVAVPHFSTLDRFLADRGGEFDLVVLSRLEVAAGGLPAVRRHCPQALVVFDTVDLHFLRESRGAAHGGNASTNDGELLTREIELDTMLGSDLTVVCSTFERDFLRFLHPDAGVEVISLVHAEARSAAPLPGRAGLLFVGGFEHPPNADGIVWFVEEILPLVQAVVPTTLHVVGSRAPDRVLDLASDHVIVHGFVDDLAPLYDTVRVTVAPLRFGAGVKGKVIQSLMVGVPVVGTSVAVEGTPLRTEIHALVGDTPAEFADAVVRVLTDDVLWTSLADQGRALAEDAFGVDAARAQVAALVDRARDPARSLSDEMQAG